jgi:hypothetical protein
MEREFSAFAGVLGLTRRADVKLNNGVSLRPPEAEISFGDDARTSLPYRFHGNIGRRRSGMAFLPICFCRCNLPALTPHIASARSRPHTNRSWSPSSCVQKCADAVMFMGRMVSEPAGSNNAAMKRRKNELVFRLAISALDDDRRSCLGRDWIYRVCVQSEQES